MLYTLPSNESEHTNHIDVLTGLRNNYAFRLKIISLIADKTAFVSMVFGIDNFKDLNDLHSYSFGDKVLVYFAKELTDSLAPELQLFRLDGDRFGLIKLRSDEISITKESLNPEFEQIQAIANSPKSIDELMIFFTVSAGVCDYPDDGEDGDTLYRNMRIALSAAKNGTKKSCVYYDRKLSEVARINMLLLDELKRSVKNDCAGFSLNYQPIVKSDTHAVVGCEALLRWENPLFPQGVSPFQFIPILEKSGLILEVGKFVIDTAFKQCALWNKINPSFTINVNVSAKEFEQVDFNDFVLNTISKYNLNPNVIMMELTESEQADFKSVSNSFVFLRRHGIKTAFDDFGTGYSSLDIFRSISADELKVDKSFIQEITYSVTDQIILKHIIDMCKSMNMLVCVEGIETTEVECIVSEMGPILLQGYLFSRPISATEFEQKYITLSDKEQIPVEQTETLRPTRPLTNDKLLNGTNVGLTQLRMDKNFSFLAVNDGFRRMFGHSMDDIKNKFGNSGFGLIHPDDMDMVLVELQSQLSNGDSATIEYRLLASDGNYLWVLATGTMIQSADGIPSLIVALTNIDKQKKERIKETEAYQLLLKILNKLPVEIKILRDDDGFTVEYMTDILSDILGYTKEECVNQFQNQFLCMIHDEDKQGFADGLSAQREVGQPQYMSYRTISKSGLVLFFDTIFKYYIDDETGAGLWSGAIINISMNTDESTAPLKPLNMTDSFKQALAVTSKEILFDYNFDENIIAISENSERLLGYHFTEDTRFDFGFVHAEDRYQILNGIQEVRNTTLQVDITVRIDNYDKSGFIWCNIELSRGAVKDEKLVSVIGKITDIDDRYRLEAARKINAECDTITGMLNRTTLGSKIAEVIAVAENKQFALFVLDIDDFGMVNNIHGNFIGDKVLDVLAQRIQYTFRKKDVFGRSGGDEFTIFAEYEDISTLQKRSDKLLALLSEPIVINDQLMIEVHASIGVSCFPQNGLSFSDLFLKASNALYRAKYNGKNCYIME